MYRNSSMQSLQRENVLLRQLVCQLLHTSPDAPVIEGNPVSNRKYSEWGLFLHVVRQLELDKALNIPPGRTSGIVRAQVLRQVMSPTFRSHAEALKESRDEEGAITNPHNLYTLATTSFSQDDKLRKADLSHITPEWIRDRMEEHAPLEAAIQAARSAVLVAQPHTSRKRPRSS